MTRWTLGVAGAGLMMCAACGTTSFSAGSGDGGTSGDGSHTGNDGGHVADAHETETSTPGDTGARDAPRAGDGGSRLDGQAPAQDAGRRSCPDTAPTNQGSCPAFATPLLCEYGSDPRFGCNPLFTCSSRQWTESVNMCAAPPANGASCPTTWDAGVPGAPCTALRSGTCDYPQADCMCNASSVGGTVGVLECDVPEPPGDCPIPRPRAGTSCTSATLVCDYGACHPDGVELRCGSDLLWQPVPSGDFSCSDGGVVTMP